jgi:phosphomannomutase
VVAEYLRAAAAAVPISANDAVERSMGERRVTLEKTKIGSPYVISALDELRRAGKHTRIVGWEANGGFLTGSDIPLTAGTLIALPTRDSTLPILANLFAAAEQRIGLPTLWSRLPTRYGRAGLLDNVPVAVSQAILAHLIPPGDVIEVEFDGTGHVFDRSRPGAAPSLLAELATLDWQQRRATFMRFFTPALGFDDIVRIKISRGGVFDESPFPHERDDWRIRPSGNAPQLRIYANSESQARADQIVELGLREPDGILRQLEQAFSKLPRPAVYLRGRTVPTADGGSQHLRRYGFRASQHLGIDGHLGGLLPIRLPAPPPRVWAERQHAVIFQ